MGIEIRHGKPSTIIRAAQRAGEAQAALKEQEKAESLQAQQMEFDYRTSLKQQDMVIDLQMQERSKMWEIEKMELRSRMDFEREEKKRQQVLDQYEASVKYINDSDLFDESQKERLLFTAKLKASKADIPGLSRILFPEVYEHTPTQRQVTPTQRVSAMKKLREEEAFQEPTWLQGWLPGGKRELSEDVLKEKAFLESIAAGQYTPPTERAVEKTDYQLGEIITRAGKQYRVTGFDTDGMPLVDEI